MFEKLDIREAVSVADGKVLQGLVGMVRRQGMKVVEIGSWKGFSTYFLAQAVAASGGSVFAVDHWRGNEGTWNIAVVKKQDIFATFKRNMTALGVYNIVHPLVMDSKAACPRFADGSLDLVFIDADHRYHCVKSDIVSWLRKVRVGGILCGHDCEGYYSKYPDKVKKVIDDHLEADYTSRIHCGVVRALYDCFGDKYSKKPGSFIWFSQKSEAS